MEQVCTEIMEVRCDKCGSTHKTDNMKDFKDSNTYPPAAHFMCLDCKQMATVQAGDMPKRLFSHLVNKVTKERFGDIDQRMFDSMSSI